MWREHTIPIDTKPRARFALVFCLLFTLANFHGAETLWRWLTWKQVRGNVLSVTITPPTSAEGNSHVSLTYAYQAIGTTYRADMTDAYDADITTLQRRYSSPAVTVWYDPASPARSMIQPTPDSTPFTFALLFATGAFFTLTFLSLYLRFVRAERAQNSEAVLENRP